MLLLRSRSESSSRRAVVLLAVLIVIVVLSLAAYKYNDWMMAEARAADSNARAGQARAFATSGVHYVAAMLANNSDELLAGNPWDNEQSFRDIAVPTSEENARVGKFSILSLRLPDEQGSSGSQGYRFGVTDEAGKINLNALLQLDRGKGDAGVKLLMALPNMTEDVANAILDWLDPDDTARTNGAENEYYSGQEPAYRCKNGPFDSLEELLLVKGVTPQLLFGTDRNRNGIIDGDEEGGETDLGWQAYLTVYSREVNVDAEGNPRVYLNDKDLAALSQKLSEAVGQDLADYILAYRLYGGSSSSTSGTSGTSSSSGSAPSGTDIGAVKAKLQEDLSKNANKKLNRVKSLWDLASGSVSVTIGSGRTQKKVSMPSPLAAQGQQRDLLPKLLDKCTTSKYMDLTPRININTAPQAVLNALKEVGGLTDTDISSLTSKRPVPSSATSPDPIFQTPAWLVVEANLPVATAKKLETYVTTQTQVYRFQSLGYFEKGGPIARVEAVVDTNQGRPRIVYFRDISELGKGFDLTSASK